MADSSTPNLLGASEGFNELANQLSSIKSFLQGALEAPIETVVAELIGSLGILDADFSALIPELSSIADISFISEIQNLIALDAGSLSSLSALANIESQFGDVLSGAGFDLGGIISDATGALSGTFDDLTGGILDQVTGIVDSATGDILGQVTGVADNLVGGLIGQVTGGVADIVDIARGLRIFTFGRPVAELEKVPSLPMENHFSAYYIRLSVADKPGVIADISAILRDGDISMETMLQHGRAKTSSGAVTVVITTHEMREATMTNALAKIATLDEVEEPPCMIRMEAV